MIERPFDTVSRAFALVLAGIAAFVLLGWFHTCAVDRAEQAGYDRALRAAVVSQPKLVDTVRLHTRVTDISMAKATQQASTLSKQASAVQDVASRIPQVIRDTVPVVDTLIVESKALADSATTLALTVTTLRGDVLTERTARESLQLATSLIVVAKQDSIQFLVKRPTKKRAAFYGMVSLGVGYLIGRSR
jgi:hypothetical protein